MHIRARNNTILVKPRYDVLLRLNRFAWTEGVIPTKEFGDVKVHGSANYKNATPGNNIAWGEVLSCGQGAAWMQGHYRIDKYLREGDIVGFDSCQMASTKLLEETTFFLPVNAALCRFNPEDERPKPIGPYMLTVEEEGLVERITYSKAGRAAGLVAPRHQVTGEIKVSDSPTSQVKFTAERVLDVGTGGCGYSEKFKELVHVKPDPEAIGSAALFMFVMSVDCHIEGKRHRFTNWDRVRCTLEG